MRTQDEIDLTDDPPPDLVIEVDVSRTSIGKLGVFAAFGIPETWRYDGQRLRVYGLNDGEYSEIEDSRVLPGFPIERIVEILDQRGAASENDLIRGFRDWLRDRDMNSSN